MVKSRQKFNRTPLPSLILSNVNRLFNKTDELFERVKVKNDYAFCQALCFTETWLTDAHPDKFITGPVSHHTADVTEISKSLANRTEVACV